MTYIRKTKDVWYIETNYGNGWEKESSYDNYDDAKEDLPGYREHVSHYGGRCRLAIKRVRLSHD